MKPYLSLALLGACLVACNTTSSRQTRTSVDDDALVQVPISDRDDINKARSECQEAEDRIEVAERDVDVAKEKLRQAEHKAAIAKDEVDEAWKRCKNVDKIGPETREAEQKAAAENCEAVCAHARWADAQVVYHEHVVKEMNGRVDLEKARKKLADARVELAKAKAVNQADHNTVDPYDVAAFESEVAARKLDVEMAEVDREAWNKKMKLCRDAVDAQAKAVPASYGSEWRKSEEVPPARETKD